MKLVVALCNVGAGFALIVHHGDFWVAVGVVAIAVGIANLWEGGE